MRPTAGSRQGGHQTVRVLQAIIGEARAGDCGRGATVARLTEREIDETAHGEVRRESNTNRPPCPDEYTAGTPAIGADTWPPRVTI